MQRTQLPLLEPLYLDETKDDDVGLGIFEKWLWGTDCNAKPQEKMFDTNEMHAMGVMCCVMRLRQKRRHQPWLRVDSSTVPNVEVAYLQTEKSIGEYSIRQWFDQMECLQLHWGPVLSNSPCAASLLGDFMARLGEIVQHAYLKPFGETILDDPQHTIEMTTNRRTRCGRVEESTMMLLARKSMRHGVCMLHALWRVYEIMHRARPIPSSIGRFARFKVLRMVKQHHVEASTDLFYDLQQIMHLAPGMRMIYRTNFSGMYNHVSQVIYFHYPKFVRRPPLLAGDGAMERSPMHMLPPLLQLFPQVALTFEDDSDIPGITSVAPRDRWSWLVCCGTVFLLRGTEVYSAETTAALMAFYLQQEGIKNMDSDGDDDDDDDDDGDDSDDDENGIKSRKNNEMGAMGPYAHVNFVAPENARRHHLRRRKEDKRAAQ